MSAERRDRQRADAARTRDRRPSVGRLGERLAAEHLQQIGWRILERNVRTRQGEIDLIALDGRTLVFVEVKTRRAGGLERDPLAALGARQRARLRRLAVAWLCDATRRRPTARSIRFDAIGVVVDRNGAPLLLQHIPAAW